MSNKIKSVHCFVWKLLFLITMLSTSTVFGQQDQGELTWIQHDSIMRVQQDSLVQLKRAQDSLAYNYLLINTNRPNLYLDELKTKVIVVDNDFVKWMGNMKSLNRIESKQVLSGQHKYHRSILLLAIVSILFIGLGLVRIFFYSTFQNIVYGLFNERILMQISKEDSILTSWPYIFLYLIFSMSLGLFALMYYATLEGGHIISALNFIKISSVVAILFVVKILLIRIISIIFETERIVREYISVLYLLYFNSAIFLLPLLVYLLFSPTSSFQTVLIFYLSIVSLVFIYRFIRTGVGLIAHLKFSIFYLILYLCTLEIAPILILVRTLNN